MSYHLDDTIAAIATAPGGGARGIVRISGRKAFDAVAQCFQQGDGPPIAQLRRATAVCGQLNVTLESNAPKRVPCDLFLWPDERSYTREPVAEMHTLGSTPVLQAVLAAVCAAGARLAEPGEFTLRAFLAGRIDLTQAEAVLGVIDAHGQHELSAALAQLAGGLARPLGQLREELVQLLAELEAGLDFVDEDIQFISPEQLLERLRSAANQLRDMAAQMESRGTAASVAQVVLVGPPNVGKSSLFNALINARGCKAVAASAPAAIVSDDHGTTRDYLTAILDLDGIHCELVDTAGVTESWERGAGSGEQGESHLPVPSQTSLEVNRFAQAMTTERRERATLRVLCVDATTDNGQRTTDDVIVLTKADLSGPRTTQLAQNAKVPVVVTSNVTGQGLDTLCATLRTLLTKESAAEHGRVVAATADRCRDSLRLAEAAIERAAEVVAAHGGEELVAAEIRDALHELGKVVGAIYTDDLLDRIFKTFCIGK